MSELRWILLLLGAVLLGGIYLWGRRTRGPAAGDDDFADGRIETLPDADPFPVDPMPDEAGPEEPAMASRWRDDAWTNTVTDLPEIRFDANTAFDDPLAPHLEEEEPVLSASGDENIVAATAAVAPSPASAAPTSREAPSARRKPAEKRKIIALRLSAPVGRRYDGSPLRTALERNGLVHGKYGIFHHLHGETSVFSVASMVEPGAFDLQTMGETQFAGVTLFALLPGPLGGGEAFDRMLGCARDLEQALGGELQDERGAQLTTHRAAVLRDEILDFEHLLGAAVPTD